MGWWSLTAAYATLIAVGAVVRVPPAAGRVIAPLDKAIHLCEYLLLAWCIAQASRVSRFPRLQALIMACLCATAYGAMLELVQSCLPYRSAEWGDAVANTVGAVLGVMVARYWPGGWLVSES